MPDEQTAYETDCTDHFGHLSAVANGLQRTRACIRRARQACEESQALLDSLQIADGKAGAGR